MNLHNKTIIIILYVLFSCLPIDAENDFIVIALGESCGVSAALEIFNLKKASYPFEWCISEFDPLYNSLKNKFHDYTDPTYFTQYFDNRSLVNKYGIVFAHDFPIVPAGKNELGEEKFILDPKWREKLPIMQAKYQRRIDRFNAACTSGKKVYFVRFLGILPEWAERLPLLISSLYPNLDFTLIYVRLCPPHLGTWNIHRTKNYYIDTTIPSTEIDQWKNIFIDAGIITPEKSWNTKKLQEEYASKLCGQCSYCKDFSKRNSNPDGSE